MVRFPKFLKNAVARNSSQKSPGPNEFQYLLKEQICNTTYVVAAKNKGNRIMASDKQLQANRANAKKSTGPRSQGGKSRSRLNSRKHGLTAKTLIIVGECADDFDQLRAELMDEHDPQSALEAELVERLAGILWRLRRVPFFEAAILGPRGDSLIGNGFGYGPGLEKLGRHEATLMNAFTKTLQMLLLLQDNRSNTKSEPAMLEAVALPPAA
jgi:hypothetical protein